MEDGKTAADPTKALPSALEPVSDGDQELEVEKVEIEKVETVNDTPAAGTRGKAKKARAGIFLFSFLIVSSGCKLSKLL